MAQHKGSVLGGLPDAPQPSQKMFETRLVDAMQGLDLCRPVYVEAESRRIGRIAVPTAFIERLRASPCVEIDVSRAARVEYLLRDYAWLGADRETLVGLIGQLRGLQSNASLERWSQWARSGELEPLVQELLELHYDPQYAKSQHGNFLRLKEARRVEAAGLSDADVEALAGAIRQGDAPLSARP